MSSAAQGTAAAPAASSIEALQRRLLELRAQIDSILDELATHPGAPALASACAPGPAVLDMTADEGEEIAAPADEIAAPAMKGASAADAIETDPASDASTDPKPDFATVELLQPGSAAAPQPCSSEQAMEPPCAKADAAGAPAPLVAVAESAVDVPADAKAADPSAAPSTEPASTSQIPAAAADVSTPAPIPAAPVIAFEPRHRKEKGVAAPRPAVPLRRRRGIATRIAASIIALISAATALSVADRALVNSAYSLPWKAQLPAYAPADAPWRYLAQLKRAIEGGLAGGGAAHVPTRIPAEALALRHRQVWPTSP